MHDDSLPAGDRLDAAPAPAAVSARLPRGWSAAEAFRRLRARGEKTPREALAEYMRELQATSRPRRPVRSR